MSKKKKRLPFEVKVDRELERPTGVLANKSFASSDPSKCKRCQKLAGLTLHSCPYRAELFGNTEDYCNCCKECRRGCAEEV